MHDQFASRNSIIHQSINTGLNVGSVGTHEPSCDGIDTDAYSTIAETINMFRIQQRIKLNRYDNMVFLEREIKLGRNERLEPRVICTCISPS